MPTPIKDLRQQIAFQYNTPTYPVPGIAPKVPLNVKVTGKEGYLIVQWRPTGTAEAYQIAIMSDQNLATPDLGLVTVGGSQSSQYHYAIGNVVLTRYFAVRSLHGQAVSRFSPIVSATSTATTDSGAAEPAQTFPPQEPDTGDDNTTEYIPWMDRE